jgi:hypothetical protein
MSVCISLNFLRVVCIKSPVMYLSRVPFSFCNFVSLLLCHCYSCGMSEMFLSLFHLDACVYVVKIYTYKCKFRLAQSHSSLHRFRWSLQSTSIISSSYANDSLELFMLMMSREWERDLTLRLLSCFPKKGSLVLRNCFCSCLVESLSAFLLLSVQFVSLFFLSSLKEIHLHESKRHHPSFRSWLHEISRKWKAEREREREKETRTPATLVICCLSRSIVTSLLLALCSTQVKDGESNSSPQLNSWSEGNQCNLFFFIVSMEIVIRKANSEWMVTTLVSFHLSVSLSTSMNSIHKSLLEVVVFVDLML